jgi:flagellar protein FlaG
MSALTGPAGIVSAADWSASLAAPAAGAGTAAVNGSGTGRAAADPAVPAPAALPDPQQQARIAAQQLQEYLRENGHDMKFSFDEATGMTIVRIFNSATGELVRQIPNAEVVHIAAVLRQEGGRNALSVSA